MCCVVVGVRSEQCFNVSFTDCDNIPNSQYFFADSVTSQRSANPTCLSNCGHFGAVVPVIDGYPFGEQCCSVCNMTVTVVETANCAETVTAVEGDSDYEDRFSWSNEMVPRSCDHIIIPAGSTVHLTADRSGAYAPASLTIAGGVLALGTLSFGSNSMTTVIGAGSISTFSASPTGSASLTLGGSISFPSTAAVVISSFGTGTIRFGSGSIGGPITIAGTTVGAGTTLVAEGPFLPSASVRITTAYGCRAHGLTGSNHVFTSCLCVCVVWC